MRCRIKIVRVVDGEIAEYDDEICDGLEDERMFCYMWADGNYACDCNRELFFNRARNKDEDGTRSCSDDRFEVEVRRPDGTVLYSDIDEEE